MSEQSQIPPEEFERQWMAYLDGELSAAEAQAFAAGLSAAQRAALEEELQFERVLGAHLADGPACPEPLWRRTQLLMRNNATRRGRRWTHFSAYAVAAAAVVLIAAAALWLPGRDATTPGWLAMNAATVSALRAEAVIPPEEVDDFFADQGLPLQLADFDVVHPESKHPVTLLGARHTQYRGEPVVEVLYNCCERPVKLVVAPAAGRAAALMAANTNTAEEQMAWHARDVEQRAAGGVFSTGDVGVQKTRDVAGYRLAVVSVHLSDTLLDVVQPVKERVAAHGV